MSEDIRLTYRRVGLTYTGTIDHVAFDGLSFAEMMTRAHYALVAKPQAGLLLQRVDRDGLLPVQFDTESLELLRTDAQKYIDMHTIDAPVRVVVNEPRVSTATAPASSSLRVGHDTLAAAFGDRVYLRSKNSMLGTCVEHPATGRWVDLDALGEWSSILDTATFVYQPGGFGWVVVSVTSLLATNSDKFYLPREWNPHGIWISKDQLRAMHEQFIKEKSDVIQQCQHQ